MGERLTISF